MQALNDDARTVSQVTGLKLRMSGDVDDPVVVGGFPLTGLDTYVGRLVRAGHSVAIAAFAAECLAGRAETPPHHRDDSSGEGEPSE